MQGTQTPKTSWDTAVRNAGVPVAWRPGIPQLKNSREAVLTLQECNHNLDAVFGTGTREWLRTHFPEFPMTPVPAITTWDNRH